MEIDMGSHKKYSKEKEVKEPTVLWVKENVWRRNRYLVYVPGHRASTRYSRIMLTGSDILKVTSTCAAAELWYFSELKGHILQDLRDGRGVGECDHVKVAEDLVDLEEIVLLLEKDPVLAERLGANSHCLALTLFRTARLADNWARALESTVD
jgi:hypothetical protein